MAAAEPLPESFSYRESDPDALSKVKTQGNYNTCNLHAVLTLMETKLRLKEDKGEDRLGILSLSVEHVIDEFAKDIKDIEEEEVSERVRNVIENRGVVFEEDYSCKALDFDVGDYYSTRRARKYAQLLVEGKKKPRRVFGRNYRKMRAVDFPSEGEFIEEVKAEMLEDGPVIVAFKMRMNFENLGAGELLGAHVPLYRRGERWRWHAALLVGWGQQDGVKFFEIQNSFGSSWGDQGYGRILEEDVLECYMWDVVYEI